MNLFNQLIAKAETLLAQCVIAANKAAGYAAALGNAAPIDSPTFIGTPRGPTPAQNSNSTLLATTAYLDRLFGTAGGVPTLDNTGRVPVGQIPVSLVTGLAYQGAWNASTNTPHITSGSGVAGNFYITEVAGTVGVDGITTWAVGDWIVFGPSTWTKVAISYTPVVGIPLSSLAAQGSATFVANAGGSSAIPTAISSVSATGLLSIMVGDTGAGGTKGLVPAPAAGDAAASKFLGADGGWHVLTQPDLSAYALLASPAFSGTPTATTQAADTTSTALATTAFVIGQASDADPKVDGTKTPGTSKRYSRTDHVHPTDTSRAVAPQSYNVASLPTTDIVEGTTAIVIDGAASQAWGAVPVGGGSTKYLVWAKSGPVWTIIGK